MPKIDGNSAERNLDALDEQQSQAVPVARRCEAYLERIRRCNPELNAFSQIVEQSAKHSAQKLDERSPVERKAYPLHGLAAAVKDNIDAQPTIARAGLPFLENNRPSSDASVVRRLRDSGAYILGATHTDSGAFGVTTPTVFNPTYPNRFAGGSSGGSAAAVAADLCDFALGTDTGGSIRIPAACCGVLGFKPTVGSVPLDGVRPLTRSYDHLGPIAKSLDTITRVMGVIGSKSQHDVAAATRSIGIPWRALSCCDPEVMRALEDFADTQSSIGISISDVDFPSIDELLNTHIKLSLREAADLYSGMPSEHQALLPEVARESLDIGRAIDSSTIPDVKRRMRELTNEIDQIVADVGHLVMPTLPILPPLRSAKSVSLQGKDVSLLPVLIRYTAPFNQTGHPVLSFPWTNSGAQITPSLQLVGPRGTDRRLLSFAKYDLTVASLA